MSSPVLCVTGLSKSYGHGAIFSGVSFEVDRGATLGLFGQSGSGKSTLGRCVMRLERPTTGTVTMLGADLFRLGPKKLRSLRPSFQMVFQHPEVSLNPRRTLAESVAELLMVHRGLSLDGALDELQPLIARVGLRDEHLDRYPHQLSGGEVQRAILARIFSVRPRLIVADEPTSMLDVSVQAQVLRLMQELQRETGVSYVFISHDPDVMRIMCDTILWFDGGAGTMYERDGFVDRMEDVYASVAREHRGVGQTG